MGQMWELRIVDVGTTEVIFRTESKNFEALLFWPMKYGDIVLSKDGKGGYLITVVGNGWIQATMRPVVSW
jgi:hypothetical protein